MAVTSIHQTIHGYRDGHRLLSSSLPLGADSSRAMLVMSDMSGPSMQPGFEEYLTGYPLPGADYFVIARTWYAPEMQRPGCVWTHSLLIPRTKVAEVGLASLLESLQRPRLESVDGGATAPLVIDGDTQSCSMHSESADKDLAAVLVGAVLGQACPVIVATESAAQLEPVILRVWGTMWPAAKVRFAFCTGALMPRSLGGSLLDLQAVPRTLSPSQFRRSASSALVLDLRAPTKPEAWVHSVLDDTARGDGTFRRWLEAAAGADAGRSAVPILAPIFGEWHAPGSSALSIVGSVVTARDLDPSARSRLVGMLFDRADAEAGVGRRRELLQGLCGQCDADLDPIAAMLEDQTRRLFADSRKEGSALVLSLLGCKLTEVGERVLRTAVLSLVPNDLETFGEAQAPFLPAIVGANPSLAYSLELWNHVGGRSGEVLSQLDALNLNDEERGAVVDAILSSGREVSVDALIRYGGKIAIFRGLAALAAGQIQLSWAWRSSLAAQPDTVLEWIESLSTPSLRDLELGSRFLSPKATQTRLVKVWKAAIAAGGGLEPRVAAFGLALAFWEGVASSSLLVACFQPTYDAAGSSRLEYDEWDWLRELAPSVSWYRDWDRCERLSAAVARLLEKQNACLETVFGIVQSRHAIRKVAIILKDDRDTRPYLKSLRKTVESSSSGTREQRDALLEDG